jgi:hypothetical protein
MNRLPIPKKLQINLTGFLTDSTPVFMAALWNLLIEAQASPAGIPQSFVEEKKEEMRRAKEGDTRALTERDRRQRLDEIRDRERSERSDRGGGGRGRGRGRGRRGRGGIGNDDRPRDNGWSSRGGGVSNPSLAFNTKKKHLTFFSVHDIALPPILARLPPVAGRPPAIARLFPADLGIALAPAAPSPRVRVAHLHAVGLPPLEVPPRRHHAGAGAARPLSHHETTSGTAGVEGVTAAAHRHAEDVSAHHRYRGGALPVETPTTLVADAV